ncbi:hypothetical protein MAIT1_02377 [Magnetofaba australis IT-1]|uniref:Transposase n=2 Tax=Magnetofaba TaxID=1472292 RepID=A0A1Y2K5I9_9PROT|nr:hypothetical protein MAIT1_02377 [Magnetofaba australis IT-1]
MVEWAGDYPWSSAAGHLGLRDDAMLSITQDVASIDEWARFLAEGVSDETAEKLRLHERTGRPLGDAGFVAHLERLTGRKLARAKPGPKPKEGTNG